MEIEFFPLGRGLRVGGNRKGCEEKWWERNKMGYVQVPAPHSQCNHYVLQYILIKYIHKIKNVKEKTILQKL